jgi:mono/diheme cytochrome c family protein
MVFLFALLFYWGQLYLDGNAAGFDPRVYDSFHSFAEVDSLRPKGGPELILAKGKALFEVRCAPCHDSTGLGKPNQAPPLAGSEWVNTVGPGRMIRIPLSGLTGPIEVKGQQYNLSMTPGLVEGVSAEDLAALLSYIRQSWGNNAPFVQPEQVKAVMEKVGQRLQWKAEELKAIPDTE